VTPGTRSSRSASVTAPVAATCSRVQRHRPSRSIPVGASDLVKEARIVSPLSTASSESRSRSSAAEATESPPARTLSRRPRTRVSPTARRARSESARNESARTRRSESSVAASFGTTGTGILGRCAAAVDTKTPRSSTSHRAHNTVRAARAVVSAPVRARSAQKCQPACLLARAESTQGRSASRPFPPRRGAPTGTW
jgi:hypothetical protein